jgi:hypothetical protein
MATCLKIIFFTNRTNRHHQSGAQLESGLQEEVRRVAEDEAGLSYWTSIAATTTTTSTTTTRSWYLYLK